MKFTFHTFGHPGRYYATGQRMDHKTYGKHTRHGARPGWSETYSREIGAYPTRAEAQIAGRAWVRSKTSSTP